MPVLIKWNECAIAIIVVVLKTMPFLKWIKGLICEGLGSNRWQY